MTTLRRSGEHHVGFRALLDLEEIHLAPGEAIPLHEHRDLEIVTLVLEGSVGHQDALNNGTIIFPGDIHRATTGRGIAHEEFNDSEMEPAHFVRLSIRPETNGMIPGYEQRMFIEEEAAGKWLLVASRDGRGDTATIHQDVDLQIAALDPGEAIELALPPGRFGYLRILRGAIRLAGDLLLPGDAVEIIDEPAIRMLAVERSELLLLDLG